MNDRWKPAIWGVAALVLLLSILTPLRALTIFFIMVPLVVLYVLQRPLTFAGSVVAIGLAAFILSGNYGLVTLMLFIFFLIPSIVMGQLYKLRKKALTVLLAGFGVLLAQLLLELVLLSLQLRLDMAKELAAMFQESLAQFETSGVFEAGWAAETATALGQAIVTLLPMLLLFVSFLFAIITHGLARKGLHRSGIEVPGLPQAKTWRLPKSLVWYYLLALIVSLIVPVNDTGFINVIVANLLPVLQFVFMVQAVGFFFFVADLKRWSKAAPVLIAVGLFLLSSVIPIFSYAFIMIGLLDVAFPLRQYLTK